MYDVFIVLDFTLFSYRLYTINLSICRRDRRRFNFKIMKYLILIILLCLAAAFGFSQDSTQHITDSVKYLTAAKWTDNGIEQPSVTETSFVFYNKTKDHAAKCIFTTANGVGTFEIDTLFDQGPTPDNSSFLVAFEGAFYVKQHIIEGMFVTEWTNTDPRKRRAIYLFIGKQHYKFYN